MYFINVQIRVQRRAETMDEGHGAQPGASRGVRTPGQQCRRGGASLVYARTILSDTVPHEGSEFVKKVKALGKRRGIAVRVDSKRGKGSHVTLYFGERFTILRNPKDELKTGTYHAMLDQLGIADHDLRE